MTAPKRPLQLQHATHDKLVNAAKKSRRQLTVDQAWDEVLATWEAKLQQAARDALRSEP
jgi:hypothetical protein